MTISAKIFSILTMVSEKRMCKVSYVGRRETDPAPGGHNFQLIKLF